MANDLSLEEIDEELKRLEGEKQNEKGVAQSEEGSDDEYHQTADLDSVKGIDAELARLEQEQPSPNPDYGIGDRLTDSKIAQGGGRVDYAGQNAVEATAFAGAMRRGQEQYESANERGLATGETQKQILDEYGSDVYKPDVGYKARKKEVNAFDETMRNLGNQPILKYLKGLARWADDLSNPKVGYQKLLEKASDSGFAADDLDKAREYAQGDPNKLSEWLQEHSAASSEHYAEQANKAGKRLQANPAGVVDTIATGAIDMAPVIQQFMMGGAVAKAIPGMAGANAAIQGIRGEAAIGRVGAAAARFALNPERAAKTALLGSTFAGQRYNELAAPTARLDERGMVLRDKDGNIVFNEGEDGAGAVAKAMMGGVGEAAIFEYAGAALGGFINKTAQSVVSGALKGVKPATVKTVATALENFRKMGDLTGLRGQPTMIAMMNLNEVKDEVFGLGKKYAEYGGLSREWDEWKENSLTAKHQGELFLSALGFIALHGAIALNKARVDSRNHRISTDNFLKTYLGCEKETLDQMPQKHKDFIKHLISAREEEVHNFDLDRLYSTIGDDATRAKVDKFLSKKGVSAGEIEKNLSSDDKAKLREILAGEGFVTSDYEVGAMGSKYLLTPEKCQALLDRMGKRFDVETGALYKQMFKHALESDNTLSWKLTEGNGEPVPEMDIDVDRSGDTPKIAWQDATEEVSDGNGNKVNLPAKRIIDNKTGITITKYLPTEKAKGDNGYIYIVRDGEGRTATRLGVKDALQARADMIREAQVAKSERAGKMELLQRLYAKYFPGESPDAYFNNEHYFRVNKKYLDERADSVGGYNPETGKQEYLLDNIRTPQEMTEVVLHEVGRHKGLRIAFEVKGEDGNVDPVATQKNVRNFLSNLSKNDPMYMSALQSVARARGLSVEDILGGKAPEGSQQAKVLDNALEEAWVVSYNPEGVPDEVRNQHINAVRKGLRNIFSTLPYSRSEQDAIYKGVMDGLTRETGGKINFVEEPPEQANGVPREVYEIDRGIREVNKEEGHAKAVEIATQRKQIREAKARQEEERQLDANGQEIEAYEESKYAQANEEAAGAEQLKREEEYQRVADEKEAQRKANLERAKAEWRAKKADKKSAINAENVERADAEDRERIDIEKQEDEKHKQSSMKGMEDRAARKAEEEAYQKEEEERRIREAKEEAERNLSDSAKEEPSDKTHGKANRKTSFTHHGLHKDVKIGVEEVLDDNGNTVGWDFKTPEGQLITSTPDASHTVSGKKGTLERAMSAAMPAIERKFGTRVIPMQNTPEMSAAKRAKSREEWLAKKNAKREAMREEAEAMSILDEERANIEDEEARKVEESSAKEHAAKSARGAEERSDRMAESEAYDREQRERAKREEEEQANAEPKPYIEVTKPKTRGDANKKMSYVYRGKNKDVRIDVEEVVDSASGRLLGWKFTTPEGHLISSTPNSKYSASAKKGSIDKAWKAVLPAMERRFGKRDASEPINEEAVAPKVEERVIEPVSQEPAKEETKVQDKKVDVGEGRKTNANAIIQDLMSKISKPTSEPRKEKTLLDEETGLDFGGELDFGGDIELDGEAQKSGATDPTDAKNFPDLFMNRGEDIMDDDRARGNQAALRAIYSLHRDKKYGFYEFAKWLADGNPAVFGKRAQDLAALWNYASNLSRHEDGTRDIPMVGEHEAEVAIRSAREGNDYRNVSNVDILKRLEAQTDVQMLRAKDLDRGDSLIPNMKMDADPISGVVRGKEIPGRPFDLLSNPIVVMEFSDGRRAVVTGRHRAELYARNDMDIPARVIREKDGWTVDDAVSIDSISNILDGQGTIEDYVRFFRNSKEITRERAEAMGLFRQEKGRMAYALAKEAIADVRNSVNYDGGKRKGFISPLQAGAIADAAPISRDEISKDVQREVLADVLRDPSMDATSIKIDAEEVRRQALSKRAADSVEQGMFDFGESNIDENLRWEREQRRQFRESQIAELKRIGKDLRSVKNSKIGASIPRANIEALKRFGINYRQIESKDPKERARALESAASAALMEANEWEPGKPLSPEREKMIDDYINSLVAERKAAERKQVEQYAATKGKDPKSSAIQQSFARDVASVEKSIDASRSPIGDVPEMTESRPEPFGGTQGDLFFNRAEDVPEKARKWLEGLADNAIAKGVPFSRFLSALKKAKSKEFDYVGPAIADIWAKRPNANLRDENPYAVYNDFINKLGGNNGEGGLGGRPVGGTGPTGNDGQPRGEVPYGNPDRGDAGGAGGDIPKGPVAGGGLAGEGPKGLFDRDEGIDKGEAGRSGGRTDVGSSETPVRPDEGHNLGNEGIRRRTAHITGIKGGNDALEEPIGLRGTESPESKDNLDNLRDVIDKGLVLDFQAVPIINAKESAKQTLPNGATKASLVTYGTGTGKTHIICGLMLDQQRSGKKRHVWISKNDGLMPDIQETMGRFGMSGKLVNLKGASHIADGDIGFASYYTLRGDGFVEKLVKMLGSDYDGVIAFDECHQMRKAVKMKGDKVDEGNTQLAGLKVQRAFPKATIVFSSATPASTPEEMGYMERMGMWGEGTQFEDYADFAKKLKAKGANTGMEIISRALKIHGQNAAYKLSDKGVKYYRSSVKSTPEQRQAYEHFSTAIRDVATTLADVQEAMDDLGYEIPRNVLLNYQQRIYNTMIASIKAPSAINLGKQLIARGFMPVFSLEYTNEAGIENEAGKKAANGEEIDMSEMDKYGPKQILLDYLDTKKSKERCGVKYVDYHFPTKRVERKVDPVTGDEVVNIVDDPNADAARRQLIEVVNNLPDIFGNPIGMITEALGKDKVANLTGLNKEGFAQDYEDFKKTTRHDAIVYSRKANAGYSFHTHPEYKNSDKQRVLIPMQTPWSPIDWEQSKGRVHRVGQKSLPKILLLESDFPGEARFISSIAGREEMLSSMTSGDRNSRAKLLSDSDNFSDEYAQRAIMMTVGAMLNTHGREAVDTLAGSLLMLKRGTDGKETNQLLAKDKKEKIIPRKVDPDQFWNRILLLPREEQEAWHDSLGKLREELIRMDKEDGKYDPGLTASDSTRDELLRSVKASDDLSFEHVNSFFKNEKKTFDEFIAARKGDGYNPSDIEFIRRKRTGEVFAIADDGVIGNDKHAAVKVWGVDGSVVRDRSNKYNWHSSSAAYESLTEKDAREAWKAQYDITPEERSQDGFYANGDMLKYWEKVLGGSLPRTYSLNLGKGREYYTGAKIPLGRVLKVMETFGKGREAHELVLDGAIKQLLSGKRMSMTDIPMNGKGLYAQKVPRDGKDAIVIRGFADAEEAKRFADLNTRWLRNEIGIKGETLEADKKRVFLSTNENALHAIFRHAPLEVYDGDTLVGNTGYEFRREADGLLHFNKDEEAAYQDYLRKNKKKDSPAMRMQWNHEKKMRNPDDDPDGGPGKKGVRNTNSGTSTNIPAFTKTSGSGMIAASGRLAEVKTKRINAILDRNRADMRLVKVVAPEAMSGRVSFNHLSGEFDGAGSDELARRDWSGFFKRMPASSFKPYTDEINRILGRTHRNVVLRPAFMVPHGNGNGNMSYSGSVVAPDASAIEFARKIKELVGSSRVFVDDGFSATYDTGTRRLDVNSRDLTVKTMAGPESRDLVITVSGISRSALDERTKIFNSMSVGGTPVAHFIYARFGRMKIRAGASNSEILDYLRELKPSSLSYNALKKIDGFNVFQSEMQGINPPCIHSMMPSYTGESRLTAADALSRHILKDPASKKFIEGLIEEIRKSGDTKPSSSREIDMQNAATIAEHISNRRRSFGMIQENMPDNKISAHTSLQSLMGGGEGANDARKFIMKIMSSSGGYDHAMKYIVNAQRGTCAHMAGASVDQIKSFGDYAMAKFGGRYNNGVDAEDASKRLAWRLFGDKKKANAYGDEIERSLDSSIGKDVVVMYASHDGGDNVIPGRLASIIEKALRHRGWNAYVNSITEATSNRMTEKTTEERMKTGLSFTGRLYAINDFTRTSPITQAIYVDDVWTTGNSILQLIGHTIKEDGLVPRGIATFAVGRNGKEIFISREALKSELDSAKMSASDFKEKHGYDPRYLTPAEFSDYGKRNIRSGLWEDDYSGLEPDGLRGRDESADGVGKGQEALLGRPSPVDGSDGLHFNIDEDAALRINARKRDEAEEMLKAGRPRREIWEKTGWWVAKDGKWRYEIKGVTDDEFNKMADTIRTSGAYFDRDKATSSINSYRFTLGDYEKELKRKGESLPAVFKTMLAAYPNLRDRAIVLDYKTPKTADEIATLGYSSNKEIRLYKNGMTASTFNHEVQHKMQELGGMGRGTNPDAAGSFDRYQKEHGEWEARLASARAGLTDEQRAKDAPWETKENGGVNEAETEISAANRAKIRTDGSPEIDVPDTNPLSDRRAGKKETYLTNIVDRYQPWLNIEREFGRKQDQFIGEDASPHTALRLLHGHNEAARKRYEDIWKKPFLKMLKNSDITAEQVGTYMVARDAEARNLKVLNRNGKLDGSGLSSEEAKNMIEQLRRDLGDHKFAMLEEAANHLWKMQEEGLKRRVQSGRLDVDTYNKWRAEEPFHVPMRDDFSDDGEPNYSTKQWKANEFMTAEGRSTIARDSVEFMFKEYQEAMYGSNENIARQTLARFVKAHPDLGIVRKGVRKGKAWSFTHGMEEDVPDPFYFEQRTPGGAGKPNLIAFKKDGNLMMMELKGDLGNRLAASAIGRDVKRAPAWFDKYIIRPYASTATEYSPTFLLRNASADLVEASLNTIADKGLLKGGAASAKIIGNAIRMMMPGGTVWKYNNDGKFAGPDADLMKRYVESGASIGGAANEGVSELRVEMEKLRADKNLSPIKMIKMMGRAISLYNKQAEYAVRLSVFKDGIDSGKSDGEAAFRSREYTTDFNKYGNQRWMNSAWLFSGSVIGSAVRQIASLNPKASKAAISLIGGLVAYGFLESTIEHWFNAEDDEEARKKGKANQDTMSEYNRANSLYFRMGDKYARIPFHAGPFSLLKYVGNVFGRTIWGDTDYKSAMVNLLKESRDTAMHFTGTGDAGPDFAQSIMPTIFVPFYQHAVNEDYRGQPIKKRMYSETLPYSENSFRGTGEGYKQAARALNELSGGNEARRGSVDIAPETLKFIENSLFKNLGRDVEAVVDFMKNSLGGSFDSQQTPYLRDFYRTVGDNTSNFYAAERAFKTDVADGTIKGGSGVAKRINALLNSIKTARHMENGEKKMKGGKFKKTFSPTDETKNKWRDIRLKYQQMVIDLVNKHKAQRAK